MLAEDLQNRLTALAEEHSDSIHAIGYCRWRTPILWLGRSRGQLEDRRAEVNDLIDTLRQLLTAQEPVFLPTATAGVIVLALGAGEYLLFELVNRPSMGVGMIAARRARTFFEAARQGTPK